MLQPCPPEPLALSVGPHESSRVNLSESDQFAPFLHHFGINEAVWGRGRGAFILKNNWGSKCTKCTKCISGERWCTLGARWVHVAPAQKGPARWESERGELGELRKADKHKRLYCASVPPIVLLTL